MKWSRFARLLHPLFLASLLCLLANDYSWKASYHNWMTGKLSDVAGMLVLPAFLLCFFPKQKTAVFLFTATAFCWWKSPLSQPVIDALQPLVPLYRTIDGSDYLVLAVLPLATCIKPVCYRLQPWLQSGLSLLLGAITLLTLCATTGPYRHLSIEGQRENTLSFYERFTVRKSRDAILNELRQKGFNVVDSQVRYYPHLQAEDLVYRVPAGNDTTYNWIPVPHSADSVVYLRRTMPSPFFVLPFYVFSGDTLRNIEFSISGNDKKSTVWIEAFQTQQPVKYREVKQHKALRQEFERLFGK